MSRGRIRLRPSKRVSGIHVVAESRLPADFDRARSSVDVENAEIRSTTGARFQPRGLDSPNGFTTETRRHGGCTEGSALLRTPRVHSELFFDFFTAFEFGISAFSPPKPARLKPVWCLFAHRALFKISQGVKE